MNCMFYLESYFCADGFAIIQRLELPKFLGETSVSCSVPNEDPITWAFCSIRSASLLIKRERSDPVTFLPQVVLKALRAAATAISILRHS